MIITITGSPAARRRAWALKPKFPEGSTNFGCPMLVLKSVRSVGAQHLWKSGLGGLVPVKVRNCIIKQSGRQVIYKSFNNNFSPYPPVQLCQWTSVWTYSILCCNILGVPLRNHATFDAVLVMWTSVHKKLDWDYHVPTGSKPHRPPQAKGQSINLHFQGYFVLYNLLLQQ